MPTHVVLTAYTASQPVVNLDNCPELEQGYQGGCVNQLQAELNLLDQANLPVDGIFGPLTERAVVTFQQENGITPDGIVGPQTKQALDADLSSVSTPTPGAPLPVSSTSSGGDSGTSDGILDSGLNGWDITGLVGCGLIGAGAAVVATPAVGVGAGIACGAGFINPSAG